MSSNNTPAGKSVRLGSATISIMRSPPSGTPLPEQRVQDHGTVNRNVFPEASPANKQVESGKKRVKGQRVDVKISKSPSATEVFDNFVKQVLFSGGYLNTDDIWNGLSGKITDLHEMQDFKNIQGMNKVVHAAVWCYWQGRSVRVYSELEAFVIKQVAGYKRIEPSKMPANFEELGMGALIKHKTVMKWFDFGDLTKKEDLPNVTTADIIARMQDFTAKNRSMGKPDEKMEAKFLDYLRAFFNCRITGFNVEFKSLFHATNQTRGPWFRELQDAKEKFSQRYKKALQSAFESLMQRSAPAAVSNEGTDSEFVEWESTADAEYLKAVGVNAGVVNAGLSSVEVPTAAESFLASAQQICKQHQANEKRRLGLAIGGAFDIVVKAAGSSDKVTAKTLFTTPADSNMAVELRNAPTKRAREIIAACVVGLVHHLLCKVPRSNENCADADAAQSVRRWFGEHLSSDVPVESLRALQALCKKLIRSDSFVDVSNNSGPLPDSASIDWSSVRTAVEGMLQGKDAAVADIAKKFKRANNRSLEPVVKAEDFIGLVTAVILFRRVVAALVIPATVMKGSTLSLSSPVVDVVTHVATRLRAVVTSPTAASELATLTSLPGGPVAALLKALREVETEITSQLNVPAFECVRAGGSFLHLLEKHLSLALSAQDASPNGAAQQSSAPSQLLEVVCALQAALFPAVVATDEAIDDVVKESGAAITPEHVALASLQQHLTAVLSGLEFHAPDQDGEASAPLHVLLQLLLVVEGRVMEDCILGGAGSDSTSFLELLTKFLGCDPELAERVEALVNPPNAHQQSASTKVTAEGGTELLLQGPPVSVEMATAVVLQHLARNAATPATFPSLQSLTDSAAVALISSLALTEPVARTLASRVIAHLRDNCRIDLMTETGNVMVKLPGEAPVLVYGHSPEQHNDEEVAEGEFSADMRDVLLKRLVATPLGESCADFSMWRECNYSGMSLNGTDKRYASICDFILAEQDALRKLRPDCVFYHVPGSADCFPIPTSCSAISKDSAAAAFAAHLNAHDHSAAAAWCLSSVLALVDGGSVKAVLHSVALQRFESYGTNAVPRLCQELLQIAFALPAQCGASVVHHAQVLMMCLDALAVAAKLSMDTAQQCVLDFARLHQATDSSTFRRLMAVGRTPLAKEQMAVLYHAATTLPSMPMPALLSPSASMGNVMGDVAQNESAGAAGFDITLPRSGEKSTNHDGHAPASAGMTALRSTEDRDIDMNDAVSDKHAVILRLLEQDFHYTDGGRRRPPAESPEGMKLQQALKLLSANLYSSQAHFVMELVQNADDNSYSDVVTPTLRVQLFPHAVVVFNNEVGFSEQNILAVCNVNGSTKLNKTGYIGQKGIGFKSVFSVSDRPEIHSNGYHIKFDKHISMLEPIWVENTPEAAWPDHFDSSGTHYETCVRLTLSDSARKNLAKLNQDIMEAFNGKLILFLNKLERMVLEDRQRNLTLEYCRLKLSDNWMQITTSTSEQTSDHLWLVVRDKFAPLIHRLEVLPDSTEVSIAFKFVKTGAKQRAKRLLPRDAAARAASIAAAAAVAAEEQLYSDNPFAKVGGVKHAEDVDQMPYVEEVKLDFSEKLMPIYAFLPTGTRSFQFIVQGDFVLPTNRESVLENNDWNHSLFDRIPRMFATVVNEMALWSLREEQADESRSEQLRADCPKLSQLAEQAYFSLRIAASDVLDALPRRTHTSKDHVNRVISSIYDELQEVKFLRAQSDILCTPKELCSVHHLDVSPSQYISEDALFAATGLHYAKHEPGEYELDDEIAGPGGLRVVPFGVEHVMAVLVHLAQSTQSTTQQGRAGLLQRIAGALVLLEHMCRPTQALSVLSDTGAPQRSLPKAATVGKGLVPSQTYLKRGAAPPLLAAPLVGFLNEEQRAALRVLPLWPLQDDSFTTFEHTIAFLPGQKETDKFSPPQEECFNVFSNRVQLLSPKLFDAAAQYGKSNKDVLQRFLLENFRPVRKHLLGRSTGGSAHGDLASELTGGVEELTPDIVVRRVIFPAYRSFAIQASSATVSVAEPPAASTANAASGGVTTPPLDRTTAAAFLAFFFLSKWSRKLNEEPKSEYAQFVRTVGVVVPVLSARDTNAKKHVWDSPQLIIVRTFDPEQAFVASGEPCSGAHLPLPDCEVHVGLETPECAVAVLSKAHTVTAFRQLDWKVLDPHVAALAFGLPQLFQKATCSVTEVEAAFGRVKEQLRDKHWLQFQLRIGLVNLFGVYNIAQPSSGLTQSSTQYEAPFLHQYIEHLQRNGEVVVTSKPFVAPSASSGGEGCEGDEDEDRPKDGELQDGRLRGRYIPLFQPSGGSIKAVSKDVHETLTVLIPLVARELHLLGEAKRAAVMERLNGSCCFPCEVDSCVVTAARSGKATSGDSQERSFFIASPRDLFLLDDQHSRLTQFGHPFQPHCAVVPRGFTAGPSTKENLAAFGFQRSDHVLSDPSLLLKYLQWLAAQGEEVTILSNVSVMARLYDAVQHYALNSQDRWFGDAVGSLLADDAPFIWIPLEPPAAPSAVSDEANYHHNVEHRDGYVPGRMTRLSKLVKSDPSDKFTAANSPIKSLEQHYVPGSAAAKVVVDMFARRVYCYACQAAEGMFGVVGQAMQQASRTTSMQDCACKQSPFCADVVVRYAAPVRKSPSAADLMALLQKRCAELQALYDQEESNVSDNKVSKKKEAAGRRARAPPNDADILIDSCKKDISELLTALSMNIWKCFQIKRSLHPYSASQLRQLLQDAQQSRILPSLDYTAFVSAPKEEVGDEANEEGKVAALVAVDDLGAYRMFRDELVALSGRISWLGVHDDDSTVVAIDASEDVSDSDETAVKHSYDLEELARDEAVLLNSSPADFNAAVRNIADQTFSAPTNKLALFDFLGIPKLSDSIEVEWHVKAAVAERGKQAARLFVTICNNLLTFAHSYYVHGGYSKATRHSGSRTRDGAIAFNLDVQVGGAPGMQALQQMEVTACAVLERRLRLSLHGVNEEKVVPEGHHRVHSARENVLYLHSNIADTEVEALAVTMLMKVLKVTLGRIERKQEPDEMADLREHLEKIAKFRDSTKLLSVLEYHNLIVDATKAAAVWKLVATSNLPDSSTVPEPDEAALRAIEAYEKMKKADKDRSAKDKTKVTEKKLEEATKQALHEQEQARRMKALGDQVVAATAAVVAEEAMAASSLPSAAAGSNTDEESVRVMPMAEERAPRSAVQVASGTKAPKDGNSAGDVPAQGAVVLVSVPPPAGLPMPSTSPLASIPAPGTVIHHPTSESSHSPNRAPAEGPEALQPTGKRDASHKGTGVGGGQFIEALAQPPAAAHSDVLILGNLVGFTATEEFSEGVTEHGAPRSNAVSGRLGEVLAVQYLRTLLHPTGEAMFRDVQWVNEQGEAGLPYDIAVRVADGTPEGTTRYCEVKTRSVAASDADGVDVFERKQWHVSPAEIQFAAQCQQALFGMFINVRIDYSGAAPHVQESRARIVGLERGLIQSIAVDRVASLFVQINADQEPVV